jgi:hypothetical protein
MSSPSLLEQAKTGDAAAIVALMNQAFQAKGIEVQGDRQGDCLQLWLTSATLPLQAPTVAYVCQGLARLQIQPVATLQLYAQQADGLTDGWGIELSLNSPTAEVKVLTVDKASAKTNPSLHEGVDPVVSQIDTAQPSLGGIDQAYTRLELEPGATVKEVESRYFKLKAQAIRQGNRAHVENLKQAFHQLKDYLENPPPAAQEPAPGDSAPSPTEMMNALPPTQRLEALLKQRGLSAQVNIQDTQLHMAWLAVRVVNPEDAARQVHTFLKTQNLAALGLEAIETLVFSSLSRDQTIVWQQSLPLRSKSKR